MDFNLTRLKMVKQANSQPISHNTRMRAAVETVSDFYVTFTVSNTYLFATLLAKAYLLVQEEVTP